MSNSLTVAQRNHLNQLALEVARKAHAHYSHFRVGAALLLEPNSDPSATVPPNTFITGCNVENASFRLTTCAEQSAIAAAVALHGPVIRIHAILIVNINDAPCSPCGACRQTILEFATPATRVIFPGLDGAITEATMTDLLPHAFLADSFLPSA
jgi:cytidine deaminase